MYDPNSNTPGLIVNPSPRTIIMVRHGETQGNIDDKAQGHLDVPLTETGRLQAKAVAQRLSDIEFCAVYSSDLQRALDTAKAITAHRPELPIRTRTQLREIHFGDYEDMPWDRGRQHLSRVLPTLEELGYQGRHQIPRRRIDARHLEQSRRICERDRRHKSSRERKDLGRRSRRLVASAPGSSLEPTHHGSMVLPLRQHQHHHHQRTPIHTKRLANPSVQRHQPPRRYWSHR